MKRFVLLSVLVILAGSASALDRGNIGRWSDGERGWSDGWECSPRSINFSRVETFVAEEELLIPAGLPLEVAPSKNGGIKVTEGTGSSFRIRVCKAIGADDGIAASNLFPQVRVVNNGGRLSVEGPADGRWLVHFFIEAPRGSKLSLEAYNGPISVRDFTGEIRADVQNGPIGLRNVNGVVRANAQNGPISLSGGSGDFDLRTQNGPLSLTLDGSLWQGQGLNAVSTNGPLTIKLPVDYEGLVIETVGRSPVNCDEICDNAKTRWGRNSVTFEFGTNAPLVHASTKNGPLSIKAR